MYERPSSKEAVMKISARRVPTSLRVSVAALGLAIVCVSGAVAAPGTDAQRAACTPDVFRLCSSDIPNVERIVACLKRERPRLSTACQQVFNDQPAPATRSVSAAQEDTCAFQDTQHPSQKDWHSWCGPAARKQ
jgi:hypothetical protein